MENNCIKIISSLYIGNVCPLTSHTVTDPYRSSPVLAGIHRSSPVYRSTGPGPTGTGPIEKMATGTGPRPVLKIWTGSSSAALGREREILA